LFYDKSQLCFDCAVTSQCLSIKLEEEIKERIAAGNRSFFANKKIFQSKLITRKTKEKLYHTVIRPVVVYGSECWVLTENIKQKLFGIRKEVIEKNFWPNAENKWRMKTKNK